MGLFGDRFKQKIQETTQSAARKFKPESMTQLKRWRRNHDVRLPTTIMTSDLFKKKKTKKKHLRKLKNKQKLHTRFV